MKFFRTFLWVLYVCGSISCFAMEKGQIHQEDPSQGGLSYCIQYVSDTLKPYISSPVRSPAAPQEIQREEDDAVEELFNFLYPFVVFGNILFLFGDSE